MFKNVITYEDRDRFVKIGGALFISLAVFIIVLMKALTEIYMDCGSLNGVHFQLIEALCVWIKLAILVYPLWALGYKLNKNESK